MMKRGIQMEILNKREIQLYQELKTIVEKEGVFTILLKDLPKWNTLLKKINESEYINVLYHDLAVYVYKNESNFKQFEIEQKEAKKIAKSLSAHDYKVAIISAIIGALIGVLCTLLVS